MAHFEEKEAMRRYDLNDYKVKAFLMACAAGKKKNKKVWMPGKTRFDKRGGKFSDRMAGLG